MAEPTDPQELAKVQAQDAYNTAAAAIDDLLDDFPNPTWDSTRMDTWLIDAVSHWSSGEKNWSPAGIISKEWYKLEYSLIARVPDLLMDKVTFARTEFNELVKRAVRGPLCYSLSLLIVFSFIIISTLCRCLCVAHQLSVLRPHLRNRSEILRHRVLER